MSNIVEIDGGAIAPATGAGETAAIVQMIERAASNPNVDVEKFARLLEMRERVEATFAKKAFNVAISRAKGDIGPIFKDKAVDFTTMKGRTNYRFEGFDTIARAVDPVLNRYGLSYRFRAEQEGPKLRVTCILSHADGYSEETTLEAGEDHSGNKNAIQSVGSAATYLQRYTLKLALGLATSTDDDGLSTSGVTTATSETITQEQVETLQAEIVRVAADVPRFLRYFKVSRLDDMMAHQFDSAMRMLAAKGAQ